MIDEPFTLRGEYSRYDATTVSAKKNINGGEERSIDYDADCNS